MWLKPCSALLLMLSMPLAPAAAQPRGGEGFLFKRPTGTFSLRIGVGQPNVSADTLDVFGFAQQRLTLRRRDFLGLAAAADAGISILPRLDLILGIGITTRRAESELRDFVDLDDLPIEQRTTFRRVPVTAGLKWQVTAPGRSVSSLAWVPARFAPYLAAGGGVINYTFKQEGDFVDFETLDVFNATLTSNGWTGTAYGAAGGTLTLTPSVGLTAEVRYDYARTSLDPTFEGFRPIDLSGVGITAGVLLRF